MEVKQEIKNIKKPWFQSQILIENMFANVFWNMFLICIIALSTAAYPAHSKSLQNHFSSFCDFSSHESMKTSSVCFHAV